MLKRGFRVHLVYSKHDLILVGTIFTLLSFLTLGCSCLTYSIVHIIAHTYPGALYYAKIDKKFIALTIDDGPDTQTTTQILSVLKRYNSKATFFLISSRITGNEEIVIQIVQQGHELGNHMTDDEPSIKLSRSAFSKKFNEADSILSQFARIWWFRPGSGMYSKEMIGYLMKFNPEYRCVLGSVYPFDAAIPSSKFAREFILATVKTGSIIILHDGGRRGIRTVKTLEQIIPKLKNEGFQLVTLTELFQKSNLGME